MSDMTARVLQLRGYGAKMHEIVAATGLGFGDVYAIFKAHPEVQPPAPPPPPEPKPPRRRPSSVSYADAVEQEPEEDGDDDQDDDDFEEADDDDDDEPERAIIEVEECERRQRLIREREAVLKKRPTLYGEASLPSRDRRTTAMPEDWEQSEIIFARQSGDTLSGLARRYNLPTWVIKEILSTKGIR